MKKIMVDDGVHSRSKSEAAIRGTSHRQFTEDALEERMDKPESFWAARRTMLKHVCRKGAKA
jgi:hypothetical protein